MAVNNTNIHKITLLIHNAKFSRESCRATPHVSLVINVKCVRLEWNARSGVIRAPSVECSGLLGSCGVTQVAAVTRGPATPFTRVILSRHSS